MAKQFEIFDEQLSGDTMLTAENIALCLNLRDGALWTKWARQGDVPAPYPCGPAKAYRWRLSDVREYLETRQRDFKRIHNLH